ncbi:MAG: extracellular solute-binding protein [Planctomycetota bacterium]|nr:extracellular solute-binding protein [Planctomycetota bacterium]
MRSLTGFIQTLVILVAIGLTLWAFARVAVREFQRIRGGGADSVELVVMHWAGGGGQQEDRIVEDSLREFERRNPGITVRRIHPGDSGQYFTKLQTMMASGDPPDVFYMDFSRMPAFVGAGQLAELDGLVQVDDYFQPTVDAFRWDGVRQGSGPLYGVPKDFTTLGFYYNKSLFDRAGIDYPSDDWTWDDFITAARAIGSLDEGTTGAEIVTWDFVLRAMLWTEGTDILDADGQLVTDDPKLKATLDRLRSWRFDEEGTLLGAEAEGLDPSSLFLTGRLGMVGPFGRWVVPSYREIPPPSEGGFEWDFAPLPRGSVRANTIATVSWALAERSDHPEAAGKLLAWLVGPETQAAQSRLGLAIPTLSEVARSDAFIDEGTPPFNDLAYLDAVAHARVPAWPLDREFSLQFSRWMDLSLRSNRDLDRSLEGFGDWWERKQASPLSRAEFPAMPWGLLLLLVAAAASVLLILFWLRRPAVPAGSAEPSEARSGFLLALPWLVGFLVFMAGPILLSLALSFTRWNGLGPLDTAEFVGLGNYQRIFGEDRTFWQSLKVTGYYVLLAVPIGQVFALLVAMLLNTTLRGIEFFRAAFYLPSVLAGVGMSILFIWVFKSEGGMVNSILEPLLAPLGLRPPEWFNRDAAWFGVPAFALMNLWLIGGSMMIYLAGLRNIPAELYEAASIDGAGPVRRFTSITLPMLGPVLLFNGIMALIGSFQVFTQAFIMTGGGPGDDTRFYVLYLYSKAFELYDMGYASGLAWLLLLVVLLLTVLVLRTSGRFVHYEGLRQ